LLILGRKWPFRSSARTVMEELYNLLSSNARLDKSKIRKRNEDVSIIKNNSILDEGNDNINKRKKKKIHDEEKLAKIHQEEIAAFRRRLRINCSSTERDPISAFDDISIPKWWNNASFDQVKRTLLHNINDGKWANPTPIQMQTIPILLDRNDVLACAPTGSGKSGAFILPALLMASAPSHIFYKTESDEKESLSKDKSSIEKKFEIRILFLAPTRELASQLHRETQRLGLNKSHGRYLFLQKTNAHNIYGNCGKHGVDVLISTPLRLIDVLKTHPNMLERVRMVVIDEADRLLDANAFGDTKTFLRQMDEVLSHIPPSATRALFSATIGSQVQHLSESILRSCVHISVNTGSNIKGGVNDDIEQQLLYVGKEEGKILAIRQLFQKGLSPPVLVFVESKERATALYQQLLYDQIKVDLIHSGRSPSARQNSIQKFRSGETWILICTDLCARGVDFKTCNLVINYDLPPNGIIYTHRIGRTGRAGKKGKSITFFTKNDVGDELRKIVNVMKLSGCQIPEWLFSCTKEQIKTKRNKRKTTFKHKKPKQKKQRKK